MKVWAIGYTSAGMAFDLIVTSLSLTNGGYGLDASALQFLNMMRLMIFIGTPVGYIGVTLKRLHHNWEVRNNEEKTASSMRKNTKKLFYSFNLQGVKHLCFLHALKIHSVL